MSNAELGLLGHLIGDGCTLPTHAIQYTTNDPQLASIVVDLAIEVFGDRVTPRVHAERNWYQVYLAATKRLTHGRRNPVADWLEGLGAFGLRSYEKRVPTAVFGQPVEGISTFMRHLWATDGCINDRPEYPAIRYDSTSEQLSRDVQLLLLRLGINARVHRVPMPGKGRPSHRLDVSGRDDFRRFLTFVGGIGSKRALVAGAIGDRVTASRASAKRDSVPREVWPTVVIPRMAELNITNSTLRGVGIPRGGGYRGALTRDRTLSLADALESPRLRDLATSDIYWDEVLSITAEGVEDVYDLTVEEFHSFVADSIIAHNSIEQDSDIVCFVYRDEYYNGEESDQQGLAEIIIAKHRNGPTDSIKLSFLKRYAKFADLAA